MTSTTSAAEPTLEDERPKLLVVDDDEDLADTYALWLDERYEVETAYSGEEAIDALDDSFDVILLDRRMPGVPGDEVLEAIRERNLDCRVSMLTAVAPDGDVIDLPFDEYLVKPVTKGDLTDVVEDLLLRDAFDESTREYLALDATEAALERADVDISPEDEPFATLESQLRAKESDETVQKELREFDRIRRLNEIIRDIARTPISAGTRREVEHRLCELSVGKGPYRTAMVGEYSTAYEAITPTTAARAEGDGVASVGVDEVALDAAVADAVEADGVSAVDTTAIDDEGTRRLFGWGDDDPPADELVVVVPLANREAINGVLLVHDDGRGDLAGRERETLIELGEVIAAEINAVRNKQLVAADTVVDLGFRVTDRDAPLVDMASALSCHVELDGFTHRADGAVVCYLTLASVTAEDIDEYLDDTSAVESHRRLDSPDTATGPRFELTLTDRSVVSVLSELGANPRGMVVDAGEGHVSVEVAPDADVRTVMETLKSAFPASELERKREVDRSFQSTAEYRNVLADRLTERQHNVLLAAFESGYFEWPRESTAEELAETLDVSQPTLHEHLRKGLRKLTEAYAETVDETRRDGDDRRRRT